MKKQVLIFAATICIAISGQSQDLAQNQVPSVILNTFNNSFPKASDIEWEMDGVLYNVDFEIGWNTDHEIWYNSQGVLVRHKEDITKEELPKVVMDRLKANFKGYAIDDIERMTDEDKISYKIELNTFTRQDLDVIIDQHGNLISKMLD